MPELPPDFRSFVGQLSLRVGVLACRALTSFSFHVVLLVLVTQSWAAAVFAGLVILLKLLVSLICGGSWFGNGTSREEDRPSGEQESREEDHDGKPTIYRRPADTHARTSSLKLSEPYSETSASGN